MLKFVVAYAVQDSVILLLRDTRRNVYTYTLVDLQGEHLDTKGGFDTLGAAEKDARWQLEDDTYSWNGG